MWNIPQSGCGMFDSVTGLFRAYLNCEYTLPVLGISSRNRGKETDLMLWIGLLIIVGLLLIAALIGADVPPPDLF